MSELDKNKAKRQIKEIDELAYNIYGIIEDEKKVIEESLK